MLYVLQAAGAILIAVALALALLATIKLGESVLKLLVVVVVGFLAFYWLGGAVAQALGL